MPTQSSGDEQNTESSGDCSAPEATAEAACSAAPPAVPDSIEASRPVKARGMHDHLTQFVLTARTSYERTPKLKMCPPSGGRGQFREVVFEMSLDRRS